MQKRTKLPKINENTADPVLLRLYKNMRDQRLSYPLEKMTTIATLALLGLYFTVIAYPSWWYSKFGVRPEAIYVAATLVLYIGVFAYDMMRTPRGKREARVEHWANVTVLICIALIAVAVVKP